tara:strand:+ start:10145 stop:11884 length:1740 start_codon:yes stop_codon:yes gene_type:complete
MATVDFKDISNEDKLARDISLKWDMWNRDRSGWLEEKKELRNFLYATDTRTTSVAKTGWSNSTTRPKLTQIADNLHANYMATLFPNEKWLTWKTLEEDSEAKQKKIYIEAYMNTKLEQGSFRPMMSSLVRDYIEYGNCFGYVDFSKDYTVKKDTGEEMPLYIGPKLNRISPYDIVFDPTASSFTKSPKIIRSVVSLGTIKDMVDSDPANEYLADVFNDMLRLRTHISDSSDRYKGDGYCSDGFSDISHYYNSGSVELLTFYGTIFDTTSDVLYKDYIITIVDRRRILLKKENPSWIGNDGIFHAGWRERPDNLYAMGPLDNLVGMQYRLDHIENLRADIFDAIAAPKYKVKGTVEDWEDRPFERIYIGDDGDVAALVPDATALNADFQLKQLENSMEEMAGAPRNAMGIRTAGEKTAFEVQSLDNAAGRIFQHKTTQLEMDFVEPVLNAMLEASLRNLDTTEVVVVEDEAEGITLIETIDKDDITGKGKIKPVAARHFAERALRLSNLQQLWQLKQGDPSIGAHLSGKAMARILSEELGEKELFGENVSVTEGLETQAAAQEAELLNEETQENLAEQGL